MYSSLPLPEHSGWTKNDKPYASDWEYEEVQGNVRSTIKFLTKSYSCKKGYTKGYTSNTVIVDARRIKLSYCGPGCKCQDCINLPEQHNIEEIRSDDDMVDDYSKSSEVI